MSIQTTEKITREQAITTILKEKMKPVERAVRNLLEELSNEDLEKVLEEVIKDEFTNYYVADDMVSL